MENECLILNSYTNKLETNDEEISQFKCSSSWVVISEWEEDIENVPPMKKMKPFSIKSSNKRTILDVGENKRQISNCSGLPAIIPKSVSERKICISLPRISLNSCSTAISSTHNQLKQSPQKCSALQSKCKKGVKPLPDRKAINAKEKHARNMHQKGSESNKTSKRTKVNVIKQNPNSVLKETLPTSRERKKNCVAKSTNKLTEKCCKTVSNRLPFVETTGNITNEVKTRGLFSSSENRFLNSFKIPRKSKKDETYCSSENNTGEQNEQHSTKTTRMSVTSQNIDKGPTKISNLANDVNTGINDILHTEQDDIDLQTVTMLKEIIDLVVGTNAADSTLNLNNTLTESDRIKCEQAQAVLSSLISKICAERNQTNSESRMLEKSTNSAIAFDTTVINKMSTDMGNVCDNSRIKTEYTSQSDTQYVEYASSHSNTDTVYEGFGKSVIRENKGFLSDFGTLTDKKEPVSKAQNSTLEPVFATGLGTRTARCNCFRLSSSNEHFCSASLQNYNDSDLLLKKRKNKSCLPNVGTLMGTKELVSEFQNSSLKPVFSTERCNYFRLELADEHLHSASTQNYVHECKDSDLLLQNRENESCLPDFCALTDKKDSVSEFQNSTLKPVFTTGLGPCTGKCICFRLGSADEHVSSASSQNYDRKCGDSDLLLQIRENESYLPNFRTLTETRELVSEFQSSSLKPVFATGLGTPTKRCNCVEPNLLDEHFCSASTQNCFRECNDSDLQLPISKNESNLPDLGTPMYTKELVSEFQNSTLKPVFATGLGTHTEGCLPDERFCSASTQNYNSDCSNSDFLLQNIDRDITFKSHILPDTNLENIKSEPNFEECNFVCGNTSAIPLLNEPEQDSKCSESSQDTEIKKMHEELYPLEMKDLEDPGWDEYRQLTTDQAHYETVRKKWGSDHAPNPNRSLSVQNFRQRRLRNINSDLKETTSKLQRKRKAETKLDFLNEPPRKRKCKVQSTFLQEMELAENEKKYYFNLLLLRHNSCEELKHIHVKYGFNYNFHQNEQTCDWKYDMPLDKCLWLNWLHSLNYIIPCDPLSHDIAMLKLRFLTQYNSLTDIYNFNWSQINSRLEEVKAFDLFYVGLQDNGEDPTLISEEEKQQFLLVNQLLNTLGEIYNSKID